MFNLLAFVSLALVSTTTALASPSMERRLSPDTSSVVIQMFEWNWNSVGEECASFIGPAGYKYVQVSPATELIQGDGWWTSYQQVSFKLQNKRGSRDEFANMVNKCKAAGVEVLVDTIMNHMTGQDSGTGSAGTSYSHYQYQGILSGFDFHYCDRKDYAISNWDDRYEVQFCQLSNLADLKTESDYVRQVLVDHGNDLLSLGVAGFRLDAAKHVPIADFQNIIGRLSRKPYIISESIGTKTQNGVPPSDYTSIGSVTISPSYDSIYNAFVGGKGLTSLQGWETKEPSTGIDSGSAAVFVATHDSERGTFNSLTYKSPSNTYLNGHVFMLAYPYGTPTVLSSYQFSDYNAGAPNGGYGTCSGAGGANGFLCQHRWNGVANMVRFRAAVGSNGISNWQSGNKDQIAFGRGNVGFVIINNSNSAWSTSLTTSLPNGSYCDIVSGKKNGNDCTATKVSVSGGKISVQVPARTSIAIYSDSKL